MPPPWNILVLSIIQRNRAFELKVTQVLSNPFVGHKKKRVMYYLLCRNTSVGGYNIARLVFLYLLDSNRCLPLNLATYSNFIAIKLSPPDFLV